MQIRDQKKLHKENRKSLNLCSALSRLSSFALSQTNPERIISQTLKETRKIFNAKLCWMFLVEDNKIKLISLGETKSRQNLVKSQLLPKLSPEILNRTYPIICNHMGELYKKNRVMYGFLRKRNIQKFMGVPLKKDGKLVGVLNVVRDYNSPSFTKEDLKSLAFLGTWIGITRGKRVEEKLRQPQKFLEAIIDDIPNPIFIKDRKHRWVVLNQALSDLVGYPKEKMWGKSDYDFFPKEQANFFWKKDEEMFRTGKVVDIPQEPITDEEGNIHYLHTKKAPLRDSSGRITHLVGIIEDITEHKRTEEALRESESKYRDLTEKMIDIIYTLDTAGKVTSVNEVFKTVYGFNSDEVIGENFAKWIPKEDRPKAMAAFKQILSGEKITTETVLIDKDGKPHNVEFSSTRIIKARKIVGTRGIIRDITERKRVEESLKQKVLELNSFINNIPDMAWLKDAESRFIALNKAFSDVVGMKPEILIGRTCEACFGVEAGKKFREDDLKVMKGRKQVNIEENILDSKGNELWLETIKSPIFDESDKIVGTVGIARNVTKRKRTEDALRQMSKDLKELEHIVNHTPAVAFLWRATEGWPVAFVSDNVQQFGYIPEDFYTGRILFASIVHPDDLRRVAAEVDKYSNEEGKTDFTQEYRIVTKSGEVRWVDDRTWIRRDPDGTITHYQGIILDITERKRAEEALRESESKYRMLLENLPQKIFFKNKNSVYISCNDNFAQDLNIKPDEITGKTDYDFFPKKLAEKYEADDKRIMKSGKIENIEETYIQDEQKVFVHTVKTPIKDKSNNIVGILGIFWDITDRKRAEEALIRNERIARERARLLTDLRNLDRIDDVLTRVCETVRDSGLFERAVMTLHDPGRRIIHLGQVGLPPDVVEHARQAPPIDQNLRARVTSKKFRISDSFFIIAEAGANFIKSGRHIPQKRRKSVGGNWRPGDELFVPLRDFPGKIMGYLSVDTPTDGYRPDIETIQALEMMVEAGAARIREVEAHEALQRSEKKYRTLVETAQEGIGISDSEENLLFVNQAFADLLGYKKEELFGKNLKDVCDETQYVMFRKETQKRKKGEFSKYEAKLLTKRGKPKYFYISAAPLFDEDGSFMGTLAVLSDLTEIKKAREYDILLNTSTALSQTLKFDRVLKMGAEKMTQALNADRCAVLLTEDDSMDSMIAVQVYAQRTKVLAPSLKLRITKKLFPSYKQTLSTQRYIQISDVRVDPVPELGRKILRKAGMTSSLIIPMFLERKMLGIFHVGMTKKNRTFSEEEVRLIRTMANQIAIALQNCRLMEDLKKEHSLITEQADALKRQTREKDILLKVSGALSKTMDLDEVSKVASRVVGSALGVEQCAVTLATQDGNQLEIKGLFSKEQTDAHKLIRTKFLGGDIPAMTKAIKKGKPFVINDTSDIPSKGKTREYFLKVGIKSVLGAGMFFGKKLVGILSITSIKKQRTFSQEETKLVQTMANQIAVAIENARLLQVIKKHTRDLKELSSQLMKVQENERKRIAQELHDEVGQMLQSMKMNLDRIKRNLSSKPQKLEGIEDWLLDTEKLLGQTIDDIRTLTFDLRPSMLDDFGLIPTLKWYIENYNRRSNIKVSLKAKDPKYRFPAEVEITLYRIIQEALTNVSKHAQATEASVSISLRNCTAILSVRDNGVGFDTSKFLSAPRGMGLLNTKERVNLLGGSFEIISRPRKGTRVNINIPFSEVKHEEGQITGG